MCSLDDGCVRKRTVKKPIVFNNFGVVRGVNSESVPSIHTAALVRKKIGEEFHCQGNETNDREVSKRRWNEV